MIEKLKEHIGDLETIKSYGRIVRGVGLVFEAHGPKAFIGDVCQISSEEGPVEAEVIGFREDRVLLMTLGDPHGIGPGLRVVAKGRQKFVRVSDELLGRVLDGLGNPIDGKGPVVGHPYPIYSDPINPMLRKRISEPLDTGIKIINTMLTCGKGQRMGIMAGSGVGKSVLLGMMARNTSADVNVIALIGERGREVREFIEKDLGEEGLSRSVVVVATSDTSPLMRIRGAFLAAAIADYFRSRGRDVLFMMDSVTRFAMAQREIGLAAGEPPTTKGYPPSVFNLLPKLLERAGTWQGEGSVTGFYTVLVEGDDFNEPIADAARSVLDGHIVLSRELANRNQYPAVDVLQSVSRLMKDIVSSRHREIAEKVLDIMALYSKYEDIINIGAYKENTNPELDYAIRMNARLREFFKQSVEERVTFNEALDQLEALIGSES